MELYLSDLSGKKTKIEWDRTAYEYLVSISWQKKHNALITVANRKQTEFQTFELVSGSLEIKTKHEDSQFIAVVPGQPRWIDQELLTVIDDNSSDTREIQI